VAGIALTGIVAAPVLASEGRPTLEVFKSPNCGCCTGWVDVARKHGFEITVEELDDMAALKAQLGVPEAVQSCHTVKVGEYVLEGHVPMEALDKLLREKPPVTGIAVPGMPMGSPGMGDDPKARYDVMAFGGAGEPWIFYSAGSDA
jgi:hypothetical protein